MAKDLTETQVLQVIGQLEASIEKAEGYLDDEQFQDYCDSVYTAITHWRVVLRKIKQKNNGTQS